MDYHLPAGYQGRDRPAYYVDDPTATTGIIYQPDVYQLAETLATLTHTRHIVDLGCGWGDKLAAIHTRHPDWEYLGIDYGENITHCQHAYTWGRWSSRNLEQPQRIPASAVVVCADVIEHLIEPTGILLTLVRSQAKAIVLSTPERDREYGPGHLGPPPNPAHVREWATGELCALLTDFGLHVRFAGLTRAHNHQTHAEASTIVIIATPGE